MNLSQAKKLLLRDHGIRTTTAEIKQKAIDAKLDGAHRGTVWKKDFPALAATFPRPTHPELDASLIGPLSDVEALIIKWRGAWKFTAQCLRQIRDERLYLAAYTTFEAYTVRRWDISRAYALRLIGALEVLETLSPIGDILPETESQARPLTVLSKSDQVKVWRSVVKQAKGDTITARMVKLAVERHLMPPIDELFAEQPKPARRSELELRRDLRRTLSDIAMQWPDDGMERLRDELQEVVDKISEILSGKPDAALVEVGAN